MFTIYETSRGQFVVLKNGVQFSPYFALESDAAMFLHRVKYDRGHDAVACLMTDASWKQAHGISASLATFGSVTKMVRNRINNNVNHGDGNPLNIDASNGAAIY